MLQRLIEKLSITQFSSLFTPFSTTMQFLHCIFWLTYSYSPFQKMLGEKRCEAKGRVSMQDTLEHKEEHIRAVKSFKYALQRSEVHKIKLLHNKMKLFFCFLVCVVFWAFLCLNLRKILAFFFLFLQDIKKTRHIFILKDTIIFSLPSLLRQLHLWLDAVLHTPR